MTVFFGLFSVFSFSEAIINIYPGLVVSTWTKIQLSFFTTELSMWLIPENLTQVSSLNK